VAGSDETVLVAEKRRKEQQPGEEDPWKLCSGSLQIRMPQWWLSQRSELVKKQGP
jgi:hypothetical protein